MCNDDLNIDHDVGQKDALLKRANIKKKEKIEKNSVGLKHC